MERWGQEEDGLGAEQTGSLTAEDSELGPRGAVLGVEVGSRP